MNEARMTGMRGSVEREHSKEIVAQRAPIFVQKKGRIYTMAVKPKPAPNTYEGEACWEVVDVATSTKVE
jgi:hypothetical protein